MVVHSSSWMVFSQVGCCGVTGYSDWYHTQWGKGHKERLPHSCCASTSTGRAVVRTRRCEETAKLCFRRICLVKLTQSSANNLIPCVRIICSYSAEMHLYLQAVRKCCISSFNLCRGVQTRGTRCPALQVRVSQSNPGRDWNARNSHRQHPPPSNPGPWGGRADGLLSGQVKRALSASVLRQEGADG